MRKTIAITLFLFGLLASATVAHAQGAREWAIVNFERTTVVAGVMLNAGEYMVVHDPDRHARGEPCTSIYSIGEPGLSQKSQEVVTFTCTLKPRSWADRTTLLLDTVPGDTRGCTYDWSYTNDRLTEYQFWGDTTGHGVPEHSDALTGELPPNVEEGS